MRFLALNYRYRNPKQATAYFRQTLEMAEKENDIRGKAVTLISLGNFLRGQGQIKAPFQYAREALGIFRKMDDTKGIIDALNALGFFYISVDKYNESLKCLLEGLELCDKIDVPAKRAGIQYQLGNLYLRLSEPEKAREYFKRSLEYGKTSKNSALITINLNNIGLTYRSRGRYRQALDYFKQALVVARQDGDPSKISAAAKNIGQMYGELNHFSRAYEYMRESLKFAQASKSKNRVCDVLNNTGDLYFKQKEYRQAKTYYQNALEIALEIEDQLKIQGLYESLSDLYAALNDYKTGMEYYKKAVRVKDQIIDTQKNNQFLELQERYMAEKKNRDIELLKQNNQIKTITRNMFIGGFLLVTALLLVIFKKYLHLFAFWKKEKYMGQYRLVKTLGAGGMGTVFQAFSIARKDRTVAVKVLKEELSRRESNRRRFKLEGTIIDKLDHPNIIKIFERGEYHGKLFIVMEFVEGITLAEIIETGSILPLNRCLDIMKQVTSALVFIHRANIIHRDLKPENIMVSGNDQSGFRVKLLDFGLSKMKFQSRITMTGMMVGTASYMAPEQLTDLESSPASDVFSMGLIFYQVLTGNAAFGGETLTQIERQILNTIPPEPATLRPELPGGLNRLVMEMLSKEPEQRPSAEAVADRLSYSY